MADRFGEAFIEVHADVDPFDRELPPKLKKAAADAEDSLHEAGTGMGETMSESITDELGRHGKDYGRSVERAVAKETVEIKPRIRYNVRDSRGRFTRIFGRDIGDKITDEIADGLNRAAGPRGPFAKVGQAIADAIGAGFNISGKSPLITLLVPAVAALVGLILAAVQAANALVAVLAAAPAAIAGIALSVTAVTFAFHGISKAISKAFEAKNVRDFEAGLKDLTPAAQSFVRSLYPFRTMLADLRKLSQENFFAGLGNSVANALEKLRPILGPGFARLARAMGVFFGQLANFLASPIFIKFMKDIFPSTARWLARFGPAMVVLLEGLIAVADATLPFLERVGTLLSGNLEGLGYFLKQVVSTPGFQQWLVSMGDTIEALFSLLASVVGFFATFAAQLDEAGGIELITELTEAMTLLTAFLASPVGQRAMEGLVQLGITGIQVFTGLLIAMLAIIAALQTIQAAINSFAGWLGQKIRDIYNWISGLWRDVEIGGKRRITSVLNALGQLPTKIKNMFTSAGTWLINAGRNIIQGLIDGIRSKFSTLSNLASTIMGIVGQFIPGSPAEKGPFSGRGAPEARGRRMVQDFATGMQSETDQLRTVTQQIMTSIVFGADALQLNFNGAVPTEREARTAGRAVGTGVADILARRDTRLAVRTL